MQKGKFGHAAKFFDNSLNVKLTRYLINYSVIPKPGITLQLWVYGIIHQRMGLRNQHRVLHCSALAAVLLFPFGLHAEVLVVTGTNSPAITLNKNQVSDVFLGKVTSLPDGSSVTPIDQPESNPLRDEFYLKVANRSAAQAKAHWAKLYFTGRGLPPREGKDSGDVKKILNSTPGAIGYIDQSALDSSVNVVFDAK